MTNVPKVSILSPVFNEERHIDEMIDSVLAQTMGDFELVLVDDGSSDRTVELIQERASQDPRIVLVPPSGKLGKVRAFNTAFAESCGQNIVLLGGDDTLLPESLSVRLNALGEGESAAFFALRTMSQSRKHDGHVIPKGGRSNFSGGTCILTRTLADRVFPIPESLVAEDIWLSEVVKLMADQIAQRSDVVVNYRIHAGNSNPRNKPFLEMREQMWARAQPYRLLLEHPPRELSTAEKAAFRVHSDLADAQRSGRLWKVFRVKGASWRDKARAASMTTAFLFRLRNAFFGFFSGR